MPAEALYDAALGCVEIGAKEAEGVSTDTGVDRLRWWIEIGQHEQNAKEGARGLVAGEGDLGAFTAAYATPRNADAMRVAPEGERV